MEPEFKQLTQSMDFKEYIDNVYTLINTVWGEDCVGFTVYRPNVSDGTNVSMPHITYSLIKYEPGLVGKDRKEISPRTREGGRGTNSVTGKSVGFEIKGQVMDATVEFVVYSENVQECINLTRKFRLLLEKYKSVLMKNGMQNMWFLSDTYKDSMEKSSEKVTARSLVFHVRLEELFQVEHEEIEKIHIKLNVAKSRLELEGKLPSQSTETIETTVTKKQ